MPISSSRAEGGVQPASPPTKIISLFAAALIENIICGQWRIQEFCSGEGGSTNLVEDRGQRERRSGGGSSLVRGSGGSCNLVQEISFLIVIFFIFCYYKTIYGDNKFICHC